MRKRESNDSHNQREFLVLNHEKQALAAGSIRPEIAINRFSMESSFVT